MKTQIKQITKYRKIKPSNQLVLFNKAELDIIYKKKLSNTGIKNIKKIKHLFSGELVEETC